MFGLSRSRAAVAAQPPDAMLVTPPGGTPFTVPLASLPWVMFVVSGEAFSADEDGWWLFARADGGAWALHTLCHGLEGAVRGPLRPVLDRAGARRLLMLAAMPAALRGEAARSGWADLGREVAEALARDPTATPLGSVAEAPTLP